MTNSLKLLALVAGLGLAGSAWGQSAAQIEHTVKPGETIRLASYAQFDKTCKTTGMPEFSLKANPKQGRIEVRNMDVEIKNSNFADCVGSKRKGRGVFLTASPNASGSETITVYRNRGQKYEHTYIIKVTYR